MEKAGHSSEGLALSPFAAARCANEEKCDIAVHTEGVSRKACSFLSVNSFIMYLPGVRTPFRSFLLIRTLVRPFGRFDSRDFDRRGFDAKPLQAAFEGTA